MNLLQASLSDQAKKNGRPRQDVWLEAFDMNEAIAPSGAKWTAGDVVYLHTLTYYLLNDLGCFTEQDFDRPIDELYAEDVE